MLPLLLFFMAKSPFPVPASQTDTYGTWLADQEWHFAEDGQWAWILNDENRYLVEGVFEDSEERLVPNDEMKEALRLMQLAPRLLRFVLRGLELLDNATLNDSNKVEHLQLLLAEVAGNCLRGQGGALDIARAVQDRQASRE